MSHTYNSVTQCTEIQIKLKYKNLLWLKTFAQLRRTVNIKRLYANCKGYHITICSVYFEMEILQLRENKISLRKSCGGTAQLRNLEETLTTRIS